MDQLTPRSPPKGSTPRSLESGQSIPINFPDGGANRQPRWWLSSESVHYRNYYIGAIILYWVCLVQALVLNGLAGSKNQIQGGLFHHTIGEVSKKFQLRATPLGWTFSIWGIIFFGLVYLGIYITTLFAKAPKLCYATFSISNITLLSASFCLMTAWLFLFDRECIIAAAIVLPIMSWCIISAAFRINRTLVIGEKDFREHYGQWIASLFGLNFLAIYASWSSCASILNFGIFLQYSAEANPQTVEWFVPLCILVVICIVGSMVALGLMRSFWHVNLRYLLGIPFTFLWGLCGIAGNDLAIAARNLTSGGLFFSGVIALEMILGIGINEIKVRRGALTA